ncbi:transcription factor IIIB 70 kDa subunit (B-related factor) [Scheffersomyces xylosifermentans]|uniref:transcription factor IIIB 70 kDa subunit (B-related factor) n=1 Tax=Scheffersomyces xylosifermentans TaxID=1304137 RepID=UPI00315D9CD0
MSVRVQKPRACRNCKNTHFTRDRFTAAGDISCSRCGTVLEENPIVSEVQFGESSSGAAMVQGAMVGADQARATYGGRQNAMESREQTLSNGKRKIRRIAGALKIPDYIADAAGEWFKLALTQNFVQGRRSQNVLAACLYVACRKEKTHHMLIDFSSRLQISVYSLGATFLKMVKALSIMNLPLADPSIFIQHFAEKLDFKEKNTKVVKDAVKLAQRMSSDWIHAGRRPAGIAGACVLLAARMNNFRRTHAEIVAVAHVAEETLQRRLNEFKKTGSGQLSVQSFRETDLATSADPPSFSKNRALEGKLIKELKNKEETLRRFRAYAANDELTPTGAGGDKLSTSIQIKQSASQQQSDFERSNVTGDGDSMDSSENNYGVRDGRMSHNEQAEKDNLLKTILRDCNVSVESITEELERIINRKKVALEGALYLTPAERKNIKDEEEKMRIDKPRNLVKNLPKTSDILAKVSSSVELTSDDDDDIVLESKLEDAEVAIKERIWTGMNHDFMVAQERKRLKQEADELTGNTSGTSRRKRAKTTDSDVVREFPGLNETLTEMGVDESGEPLTAADSARMMLQKKSFSRKINYGTLDDLLSRTTME